MSEITVNLVGAGRVGQTLLRLIANSTGYKAQSVLSGRVETAKAAIAFAGVGHVAPNADAMQPADLWIFAVPDTQIAHAAESLAKAMAKAPKKPSVAFHCSGFYPAEEMAALRDLGWKLASAHPVLTFADPQTATDQFNGTWCGVEGDAEALALVEPLMSNLGAKVFPIRSEAKSLYHAAAVISNNFTVVLQALAREAWAEAGVPETVAEELNAALLRATYQNVTAHGPQIALTGPAARGDRDVVEQQGQNVSDWHTKAGELYGIFSDMAPVLKSLGTTRPTAKLASSKEKKGLR